MPLVAQERADPKVDTLYGLMQSFENKLGGGEGIEGLYGSLTQSSMQKVLDCLKRNSGLDSRGVFIDIGAGLGRPLLHAIVSAGVASTWGVELDRVKCDKAAAFCKMVIEHLKNQGLLAPAVAVPSVTCSPVEEVSTLDPATHAFSFWEGVPPSGKKAFGQLFASSRTLRAVAVVQRSMRNLDPAGEMHKLGFGPVLLVSNFPVRMSGSGRSFQAYVFTKIAPAAANFLASAAARPVTPAGRILQAPTRQLQTPQHARGRVACGAVAATEDAAKAQDAGENCVEVPPAPLTSLPSKARKPDAEASPASPAKKPCATAVGITAPRQAAIKAAAALAAASADNDTDATQLRPGAVDTAAGPDRPKAKVPQQVLLTSLSQYSRRTKQGTAATTGKAASGKADKSAAPAVPTRSSQRLAAKANQG